MVADVLEAIGRGAHRSSARSSSARSRARRSSPRRRGAELLADFDDAATPPRRWPGSRRAERPGRGCVALLPGDCPLLDPRELDRLLTGVPDRYVAVVPDRHGTGTNALVAGAARARSSPASARAAASATSPRRARPAIPFGVEELASLGLDLDTPADIVALTRRVETRRRREADGEGAGDMSAGDRRPEPAGSARAAGARHAGDRRGDPLGELIAERAGELADGDVVVISQKVVSKAEGRTRRLSR